MKMSKFHIGFIATAIVLAIIALAKPSMAISLSDEARNRLIEDGQMDRFVSIVQDAQSRGLNKAEINNIRGRSSLLTGFDDGSVDTVNVLVLLVDFSDQPYYAGPVAGNINSFDSLLFSTGRINPTGSMTEYYLENSNSKFYIKGDVFGWFRMPETYSYYVGENYGLGSFPNNSRGLTLDAIELADAAGVDFSLYDIYGPNGFPDGTVDGIFIVHSGPGHEESGNLADMHSHKWSLGMYRTVRDGVVIDDYTVEPEESYKSASLSHIGVFCHEYGHFIGLPDLYDIYDQSNTSRGLGRWSLMATGSYNGGSRRPAHLDAWSKAILGFSEVVEIHENIENVEIPAIENNGSIYKLMSNPDDDSEYYLVENRQQIGFDMALPGSGLLIYHVDENAGDLDGNNTDPNHYHVALEQADGLMQLEYATGNDGDADDPFPGFTNNRSFDDLSNPSSRDYDNGTTQISVWDISESDSVMTANFDITWSRPHFEMELLELLDADEDGWLEAGESVKAKLTFTNAWLQAENISVSLSARKTDMDFNNTNIYIDLIAGDGGSFSNISNPIEFTMPDTLVPLYDTIDVSITDSENILLAKFSTEVVIGQPQVLLVDADRGAEYEQVYLNDFYDIGTPVKLWDCHRFGSPPSNIINDYDIVVWFTGDTAVDLISRSEVSLLKSYLDNGGSLFLSGQWLADELNADDPDFLNNYLGAESAGYYFNVIHEGISDNPVGDNILLRYSSYANQDWQTSSQINPVNGAAPVFRYSGGGYSAVSYSGDHRAVFFNWGLEAVSDQFINYDKRRDVLARVIDFLGGVTPEIYDGSEYIPLPKTFILNQNYPNPFNPTTTISYELQSVGFDRDIKTDIIIYNSLGQRVKTLVNKKQSAGRYTVLWDGKDDSGKSVASGVYFYRLCRGTESMSKKMLLLK